MADIHLEDVAVDDQMRLGGDGRRLIDSSRVALTAILDEFELTLREVGELKVGRVLPLTGDGEGRIRLDCAERAVFLCKLGEHNDRYTLEIEDVILRRPTP